MTDGASDHAPAPPDGRRHPVALVPWVLAVLFYTALTVVQTWPLVTRLSTVLPNDVIDPVLGTWLSWWNAHTVPLTAHWWNAPMFWPTSGALAFSETLVGLSPITSPIQWLGGSPVTAYNIAFLLAFLLSAVAVHALVFELSGRHDAALIGGLVYGFNPYRIAQIAHIQVITSYWMPLALLALHRYLTTRRARWLWVFGAAWLLQALSNGYYLLFFPVLIALWLLWFARSRTTRRPLALMVGTWMVSSLPLVPLLWEYRQIHAANDFGRTLGDIESFSADAAGFLFASPVLKFWTLHVFPRAEGELFPGSIAPLIVVLLIARWLWSGRDLQMSRSCLVPLLASLTFTAAALSAVLFGPWSITIGGMRLIAVQVVSKPLSIGVLLFAVALGFEPRVADLWRRRSPLLFYVLATVAMFLLSFGPVPRFLGVSFLYRAPYAWLMALPGYDAIRVPARFAMLAVLCLAVGAALAFGRLTFHFRPFIRWGFAALAITGVLIDSWIGEMPLPILPVRLHALESLPAGTAVMELPLGGLQEDAAALYRGLYHRRPVVNGYGGYYPRYYDVLRRELAEHPDRTFGVLMAASGPLTVVVDEQRDVGGRWAMQLAAYPGAAVLGEESGRKLFRLEASTPAFSVAGLHPLPVQSVSANAERDRIALVLDGDSKTGWDSGGPQRGTEVVTVDLGSRRTVDALTMTIGRYLGDFPELLVIESSEDGREWSPQWEGNTGALALGGALRDPHDVPLTIALPHVSARLLRLRQLANEPERRWTILELTVWGQ